MIELTSRNLLLYSGIIVALIVVVIILYYGIQVYFFKTKVDMLESWTGIDVPLLSPRNRFRGRIQNEGPKSEITKNYALGQLKNKKNQEKAKKFGLDIFHKAKNRYESRNMQAPTTEELNTMNRDQLRIVARELGISTGGTQAQIKNRIIRNLNQGDFDPVDGPANGDGIGRFIPGRDHIRLKRLTATYEPLNAPELEISSNKTHKGIIVAHEKDGDISTTIIAKTPFQIKEAKAESFSDGTLVVDGENLAGNKFQYVSQSTTTRELLKAPLRLLKAPLNAPKVTIATLSKKLNVLDKQLVANEKNDQRQDRGINILMENGVHTNKKLITLEGQVQSHQRIFERMAGLKSPFKFLSPKAEYENLGDKKGSVFRVKDSETDKTEIVGQFSQQIKSIKAREINDKLVIDGKNTGNRKFTIAVNNKNS